MKSEEKLWLLQVNLAEPYEDWYSSVGIFRSLEAVNQFMKDNPLEHSDYEQYYYMYPEEIDFFDD